MVNAAKPKTKVVVIGAGIGGLTFARKLIKDASLDVTVIDKRDFQYLKFGGLRSVVQGGPWTDRVLIPLEKPLKGATFIHGAVTSVDATNQKVAVEGRADPVPYDYLVVASGARNFSIAEPLLGNTRQDFIDSHIKYRSAIAAAKHILVTGGGTVAIELVGELRDTFPDKKITLLPGKRGLLGNFVQPAPKGAAESIAKVIKSRNIDIVEKETLASFGYPKEESSDAEILQVIGGVKLSSGTELLDVDLILFTLGTRVRTSFLPDSWLDAETHEVKIDKHTLQVEGQKNVFAFGDAARTETTKFGYTTQMQGDVVFANIKSAMAGKPLNAKFKYFNHTILALPVGRAHGRVLTPLFFGGNWLTSKVKGRGLMANQVWKASGNGPAPKAPGAQ